MHYRHVQQAPQMLVIAACGLVGLLMSAVAEAGAQLRSWWLIAVWLLLVAVGFVAARLSVVVDDSSVSASFGWGWPRRRIELDTVLDETQVRNSWWHGWGIRKVSRGWMFNNGGRDAIELALRSGKVFRIGTDEPGALLAAVRAARRTR